MTAAEARPILAGALDRLDGFTDRERRAIAGVVTRAERDAAKRRGEPLMPVAERRRLAAARLDGGPCELTPDGRRRVAAVITDFHFARGARTRLPYAKFSDRCLLDWLAACVAADDDLLRYAQGEVGEGGAA